MAKIAWHTDIVVNGQGMNVKVTRPGLACAQLVLMPDVPGPKSKKAKDRFIKAIREQSLSCSISDLKKAVERAVRKTKAHWNQWHHEAYS